MPARAPRKHGGCLEKEEEHGPWSHMNLGLNPLLAAWPQAGHLITLSPSCLSKNVGAGLSPQGLQDHASRVQSQHLLGYTRSWPPLTSAVNQSILHSLPRKWASEPARPSWTCSLPPKVRNCPGWVIPVSEDIHPGPSWGWVRCPGDHLEVGLSPGQLPFISINAFSSTASWMGHQVGSSTFLYPNQINSSKSGKYSQFGVTNSSN